MCIRDSAYCSTAVDTMARFKKMTGYDTYFLTGTDEHGQKIERKAKEKGVTPQAYVDHIVAVSYTHLDVYKRQ